MSMRTSSKILLAGCLGVIAMACTPALALDGSQTPAMQPIAPAHNFKNAQDALRQGLEADRDGNVPLSLKALEYAAAGGQSLARWKLARMYEDGEGVTHDDLKAYKYYREIVASYDPGDLDRRDRAAVSSAFVAMGVYSLNGIAKGGLAPNPSAAMRLFQVAATEFRNANAQYNLARMFLDGNGVQKDVRQAAGWLNLAAHKNHCPAQALLGRMLFNGGKDIERQRAKGLMWLTLARRGLDDPNKDAWIVALYDKAMAAATDDDRAAARAYLSSRNAKLN